MKQLFKILCLSLMISTININTFAKEEDLSQSKVIYITFDDGPGGKVNSDILDTLKKENIKATFFLIGENVPLEKDLVKRIYDEGHAIGLHSMTHEKCNLYTSNTDFLKEMLDTQTAIYEVTNYKPTILRFPFGCNNSCYRLKASLIDLLHENNLKIYDWTVDTTDGANYNASPYIITKNAISKNSNITLIMHCSPLHKNSALALPQIIKYYKDNGYEFKTIDETTPEIYHYIK